MSENQRIEFGHLPVEERIKSFRDFTIPLNDDEVHAQSLRCLHCGTPFCSNNCPLHNRPVDWNRLVREGDWERAWGVPLGDELLSRVHEPGLSRDLRGGSARAPSRRRGRRHPLDRARRHRPRLARGLGEARACGREDRKACGRRGVGPCGPCLRPELARAGHDVTVYEKSERPGGLLRFGIPGFKLEKDVVERRISQLEAEGVRFELSVVVGDRKFEAGVHNAAKRSVKAADLLGEYDAVVLACGSEVPRDLKVPGREGGAFFALDVPAGAEPRRRGPRQEARLRLQGRRRRHRGRRRHGSDCVGTARRQGAGRIWQLDLSPMPPEKDDKSCWPAWPRKLRTSTSHEEGCERLWRPPRRRSFERQGRSEGRALREAQVEPRSRRPLHAVRGARFRLRDSLSARVSRHGLHAFPPLRRSSPSASRPMPAAVAKAGVDGSEAPFATSVPGVFACGDSAAASRSSCAR